MKRLIERIDDCTELYRDTATGIAWVENGHTGCGHSCHPNIDETGSVAGMKKLGYWAKDARTVKSHGFIYNTSRLVVTDKLDEVALRHCQCGGEHGETAAAREFIESVDLARVMIGKAGVWSRDKLRAEAKRFLASRPSCRLNTEQLVDRFLETSPR